MKTFRLICLLMTSLAAMSACAPATSVPTVPAAAPTDTALPRSTATPAPTQTPIPTATPMLKPEEFLGTWTVYDTEARGPNWMNFYPDGTFTVTHGPEQGKFIFKGTFTLAGNAITFNDWWFCDPAEQKATYLIRMYPDKQSIRFFPVDDKCEERAKDFTNRIIRWERAP